MPSKSYLYIQNIGIPTPKAHGIYVTKSAEAVAKLGYDVTLFCAKTRYPQFNHTNPFLYYGIDVKFRFCYSLFAGIFPHWLVRVLGRYAHPTASLLFYLLAISYILKYKPTIIQTNDPEAILVISFLIKFGLQTKLIYDVHVAPPNWLKNFSQSISLIVVDAPKYFTYFKHLGVSQHRLTYFPMGYDPKIFKPPINKTQLRRELRLPPNRFIISYVGMFETMGEEKGIFTLIKILPQLLKKFPITLYLVGGPENLEEEYRQLAHSLHLPDLALMINQPVRPNLVAKHIQASDLGWLVYPRTPRFYDGIAPMKAMEYAACKIPLIASNFPSITQLFSSKEVALVNSNDLAQIIKTIQKIKIDSIYTQSLINHAFQKVKTYTWLNRQTQLITSLSQ